LRKGYYKNDFEQSDHNITHVAKHTFKVDSLLYGSTNISALSAAQETLLVLYQHSDR